MDSVNASSDRSHTSTPAVLGALLLAAARLADPPFDGSAQTSARSLSDRDTDIVAEVEATLETQFPEDPASVKRAVAEVAAAIRFVRARSQPPGLPAAKYDRERTRLLKDIGADSTKGASVWPPTSQTAVQRFGSWNDALTAAGLATSGVGRAKGQLRFDAAAYDAAIAAFVADCESRGVPATYKEYGSYAGEHKGDVPSAAAVRKFYGSWNTALTSAG